MNIKAYTLLSLLFLSSISCQQKIQTLANSSICAENDKLTEKLCDIYKQGQLTGFSVAIVNQNRTIYNKAFGYADKKEGKLYTENTIQNIASISKTFIGIALLKAQELGKLKLDEPINKYLPFEVNNPNFQERKITIRQLANHTSSIKDGPQYERKSYILKDLKNPTGKKKINFRSPDKTLHMQEFLERLLTQKGVWYKKANFYENKPGSTFEYSNIGAALAALVLENATETSFASFTEEHIFKPLNMTNTGWSFEDIDLETHSKLYNSKRQELAYYSLITYPDGGLRTSSANIGKYLTELIKGYKGEGSLLNQSSYKELFKSYLDDSHFAHRDNVNPYNDEYDMGVFIGLTAKGFIGHSGSDPGVASFMFFNKETQTGYYLIVNTDLDKDGMQTFFSIWNALLSEQ